MRIIHNLIVLGIFLFLMFESTLLTEQRWAETDVHVAFGGICITLCGFVFSMLKRRMQITISDIMISVWLLYYVGRTWFGNEFPCRTEFLKAIEMSLLYYALRLSLNNTKVHEAFLIAVIVAGGCYEALYGAMQMIEGSSRHAVFAMTGNFQNPGPYSAYLMLGLMVGITAWLSYKNTNLRKLLPKSLPSKITMQLENLTIGHILIIVMMPMFVILPATWSRAAFVSIFIIILWIFKHYYWKYKYVVLGVFVLAGCGLYLIKQGSADGRLIIWSATLTSWFSNPWMGVGIGGFCNAVADGMMTLHAQNYDLSSAGVTENTYNIILKILVEQGVVGVVIAITTCISILVVLHKSSRPLFYGMISLLIFSMFSYPFDMLPYRIITVVIVAWSESTCGNNIVSLGRLKVVIMSTMLVFASYHTFKFVKEGYDTDNDYELMCGLHDKAFIKDYYELLPLESDNADFLFDFGKLLREQGRYNDSNAMLRKGALCSADPMFHVLMGNNHRDMQHYDLAQKEYEKSYAMMPNRLYPLYQLMLMYEEQGNTKKARCMAKNVVITKPKIESPATREMKEKACKILNVQ